MLTPASRHSQNGGMICTANNNGRHRAVVSSVSAVCRRTFATFAMCGALLACAQIEQHKEDALMAAGFTAVPANTPQRQAALATMPPHTFVHEMRNGRMLYAYADPTLCDCLCIGDRAAYDRYREKMSTQELANEQQMNDQMYHMEWDSWGPDWE
jgi:hypothetical protein